VEELLRGAKVRFLLFSSSRVQRELALTMSLRYCRSTANFSTSITARTCIPRLSSSFESAFFCHRFPSLSPSFPHCPAYRPRIHCDLLTPPSPPLLSRMSASETDIEEKVDPMVRYLQKLGAEHVEVIYEASKWVFEQDRAAGLQVRLPSCILLFFPSSSPPTEATTTSLSSLTAVSLIMLASLFLAQIFTADLEEVESLPRHATMAHLEKVGRDVCINYLEHIVHELGESGADFHEKLIELYLAESTQGKKGGGA
jgi:hypothetical protein